MSELGELFWTNEPAVFVIPTWTESRTDSLLRLAKDGLSASQIAAQIGVTRNAVIGKLSRIKSSLQVAREKRATPKPTPPSNHVVIRPGRSGNGSSQVERVELPTIHDLAPDTSPDAVSLMDIGFGQCRFPLNSPANIYKFRFCGSVADGSYCGRHQRIVYRRQ